MANTDHVAQLKEGVESWNKWRDSNNHAPVDLSGCQLDGAKLQHCNLLRADLQGASLEKAQLQNTQLKEANFTGANLRRANLQHALARKTVFDRVEAQQAIFKVTTLRQASFRRARLKRADFYRAYLRQSDLSGAKLQNAVLRKAYLERACCDDASMTNVDLRYASLVQSSFDRADLRGALVYGVAAWNTSVKDARQDDMRLSRTDSEAPMLVDDLNCAHLLSLLLDNAQIRPFLDTISSRFVLIIGRFSEERKPILDLIRKEVHKHGFSGVIFDFQRPSERSFIEVIKTLAGLSRFVIADLTDPRVVHQELDTILSEYPSVPVRPIIKEGHGLPTTLRDHVLRPALIRPVFAYRDRTHIVEAMEEHIVNPAEARAAELEALLRGAITTQG